MQQLVLGIDLGTSAVKVTAIDHQGEVVAQAVDNYPLQQPQPGYCEQEPEAWVKATSQAIRKIIANTEITVNQISGISYSGQMHGLVLLDGQNRVLRPAILWNDTRTTLQCTEIEDKLGTEFTDITGNRPLEGFTLPKLLWVKENEPDVWLQVKTFLLPKDYLRFCMTGQLAIDYSDATGTVLLDIHSGKWSSKLCQVLNIPREICPPLIRSIDYVGNLTKEFAQQVGLSPETKVFAGAADNAAGAVGAGILDSSKALASIGTSGVILKYETTDSQNYHGVLQMEDHAFPDQYYSMGVTLAAGYSLGWFKKQFAPQIGFSELVQSAAKSPIGARGLLFTPYIVGERAPYADAKIRGSFVGVDSTQTKVDFTRAVLEGIIFSFQDILQIYRANHQKIETIVAIGGGAKSPFWLQMQADIFNCKVVSLENEQGPGMGAAMIAATGLGWYDSLTDCAAQFVHYGQTYLPRTDAVSQYAKIYQLYHQVYDQTKGITHQLLELTSNLQGQV